MQHKNIFRKLLFPRAKGLHDAKRYQVHETEVEIRDSTKPSILSTGDRDFRETVQLCLLLQRINKASLV